MVGIWGAAEAGDLAEVQRLIGQGPGLLNAARPPYAMTPLMLAAQKGHVEVVRWLVDQEAAVDEQDLSGNTALCHASNEKDCAPVVRLLLERGADPTIANQFDYIPLVNACDRGDSAAVRCLLDHPSAPATINHVDEGGRTAVWWASFRGRVDVLRALLEKGADHTIADEHGRTPMTFAKQNNHPECVEALKVRCSPCPSPRSPADGLTEGWGPVLGVAGRRRSGPTCCGRPGRWPTSRGAARWLWRGGTRGRSGRRWWTSRCTA
jgi:ankyrin repeat protein